MNKEILDTIISGGGGVLLLVVALVILKYTIFDVLQSQINNLREALENLSKESKKWQEDYYKLYVKYADLRSEHELLKREVEELRK